MRVHEGRSWQRPPSHFVLSCGQTLFTHHTWHTPLSARAICRVLDVLLCGSLGELPNNHISVHCLLRHHALKPAHDFVRRCFVSDRIGVGYHRNGLLAFGGLSGSCWPRTKGAK